jgi:tricorn protease interacting factor F2/3
VASISSVADDSMEKEIKKFFRDNPTPGTERTQTQTLERIRINSKLLRRMRQEFKDG